ncbi:MAG TPA: hypothetical protein VHT70_00865 [Candidatus Saccharimonadales bacterium]|jgi:hypothetical protein|nr:hypothetical protein [Candidatus Saccharimonadales bacterium]
MPSIFSWSYSHEPPGLSYPGEDHGFFSINRDSRINGGVYHVSSMHGEAISVDDKSTNSQQYDRAHQHVLKRASLNGTLRPHRLPRAVFEEISDAMQYSEDQVEELHDSIAAKHRLEELPNGTLVDLGYYLEAGIGVCRHQALASAYLLERLIDTSQLQGEVHVERNMRYFVDGVDGHAWARYRDTLPAAESIILDVANQYYGPVASIDAPWEYQRPTARVYTSNSGDVPLVQA